MPNDPHIARHPVYARHIGVDICISKPVIMLLYECNPPKYPTYEIHENDVILKILHLILLLISNSFIFYFIADPIEFKK